MPVAIDKRGSHLSLTLSLNRDSRPVITGARGGARAARKQLLRRARRLLRAGTRRIRRETIAFSAR